MKGRGDKLLPFFCLKLLRPVDSGPSNAAKSNAARPDGNYQALRLFSFNRSRGLNMRARQRNLWNMKIKSVLAIFATLGVLGTSGVAQARAGNDAQGLRQRDALADPAVKIFRAKPINRYSYLRRHDTGFSARTRCGRLSYWNGDECLRR